MAQHRTWLKEGVEEEVFQELLKLRNLSESDLLRLLIYQEVARQFPEHKNVFYGLAARIELDAN